MNHKDTILIVEDDTSLSLLVTEILNENGFSASCLSEGNAALEAIRKHPPSLLLLDISLPGMSGLDLCRSLKEHEATRHIPIVMLTGKIDESDVVLGLELGAEDYISKPFRPKELIARIRTVLRRAHRIEAATDMEGEPTQIQLGPIVMDSVRHEVTVNDRPVSLTLTEFRLLWILASHSGKVFTREQLLERLAKGASLVVDRNIDVHIGSLRKKLGLDGRLIVTVRGIGYKAREVAPANRTTQAA